jgi:WD40 repeat protein
MPDRKFTADLVKSVAEETVKGIPIEGILVTGLQAIGLVTGAGPLIALAAGVGATALNIFTRDAVDHWSSRWLGKDKQEALGSSIAPLLSKAFAQSVAGVQAEWQRDQIYLRLKARDPEEAARTVQVLEDLRVTSNTFLADIPAVAEAAGSDSWAPVRTQDQAQAHQAVVGALGKYFYGYDEGFVVFVQGRLPDDWTLRFGQLLKSDTPEGNRAWRACQQLWVESLQDGMGQLQQDTTEVRDTARWLKEWAQRLESTPLTQRDPTGQEVLDAALNGVRLRLDEIKAITERTLSNTEDIKSAITDLSELVRERTQVVIGPGAQVIQIMEEQAYRVSGLPNPYLGLRSFTYADRSLYAGREQIVASGVGTLVSPGAQRTLLFITGASGSGKSSFAQAGLLPALEEFYTQRKLQVQHAVFRPSRRPLAALADAFMQLGMPAGDLLTNPLEAIGTPSTFIAFLKANTPPQQVNVLVIDQFEELFSQSDPAQCSALLSILTSLPPFGEIRMHILATMRSDYLPELFEINELYDIAKHGIDLRAMTVAELKEAIRRPLQMARPQGDKRWEHALVDRLAKDASADATYLPLLQVTLEEIWASGSLTLDRYGTLADAVEARAEAVYTFTTAAATRQAETVYTYADVGQQQPRNPTEQTAIMSIFLNLVEVSLNDDAHRDVRRSRTKAELVGGDDQSEKLVDELIGARLLSTHVETRDERQVEMVDIIHETLIRNWDRLEQVISERRQELRQRVRFEQAAREWLANSRSDDYLLMGVRLAEAGALASRGDIALRDPSARELLDRSRALLEAEQQRALEEQRQRTREAVRRARVFRSLLVVAGVLLLAALGAAASAFLAEGRAQQANQQLQQESNSRATAVAQARKANEGLQQQLTVAGSQRLAFAALSQVSQAPETAVLLAYEARSRDPNIGSEQALRDAIEAIHWIPTALTGHTDRLWSAVFSPNGEYVLTASEDKTARVWDLQGKELAVLSGHTGVLYNAVFSPDGKYIVTASGDKTARVWDLQGTPPIILSGHTGVVWNAVFSPDSKYIVTASKDKTARVWDLQGKQLAVLSGHTDSVYNAVFSPDGKYIATASDDKTARLWDMLGRQLAVLSGHTDIVNSAVFSPDGKYIVTSSYDRTGRLWDLQGKQLAVLSGHSGILYDAEFSPDGESILTASDDNTARLWDLQGKQYAVLSGHTDTVNTAVFSPDGKSILTASLDRTAGLWDLQGKQLAVLSGHTDNLHSAVFSPDGRYILSSSKDKTARVWDTQGKKFAVLSGHTGLLNSAVFSPDGKSILTSSGDQTAHLWDTQGKELAVLSGHTDTVYDAVFSPDGKYIVTSSRDKTAHLWDTQGKELAVLSGHTDTVFDAVFSPDSRHILTASYDNTARLWDLQGNELAVLSGHTDYVNSAMFSPDGKYIVTASYDKTARIWDTQGKQLALLSGHTENIHTAVFSPDGKYILTSSKDNTARLWDTQGKELAKLADHTGNVHSAVFSPDGKYVLTDSYDKTARLWDLKGKTLAVLSGHTGVLYSAAFSPDSKYIITASDDKTARLWDLQGKQLAVLSGHTDTVYSAVFSPDGHRIVTASRDKTARQYMVDGSDLLLEAACLVGRGLTQDEVHRFGVGTPQFEFDKRKCPAVFSWEKK